MILRIATSYCFDDIILVAAKPLRIRFDKIHGFIRVYDRTRHLVLFLRVKYDFIYNRIRYLN